MPNKAQTHNTIADTSTEQVTNKNIIEDTPIINETKDDVYEEKIDKPIEEPIVQPENAEDDILIGEHISNQTTSTEKEVTSKEDNTATQIETPKVETSEVEQNTEILPTPIVTPSTSDKSSTIPTTESENKSTANTSNSSTNSTPNKTPIVDHTNTTSPNYILNTNTKKFHHSFCSSVKQIKTNNYSESNSTRNELLSQGYSPCGRCKP